MILLLILVAVAAWISAFALYVSNRIRRGAFEPTRNIPHPDLEVLHVSRNRVTLRPSGRRDPERWRQDGVWGLRWTGGHGRISEVLETREDRVTRRWELFDGHLEAGDRVRIESAAFPSDPGVAFGVDFRGISYESPAGRFDGAISDGSNETWLVFVHGKRPARPRKPPYSYPAIPVAREFGLTCFDIKYRNDPGVPRGDGLHWYGLEEWQDLEAAAQFALGHGARTLILMGYSMGGSIALSFLYRSRLAANVVGLILDAPVLDLRAVIDSGLRMRGVPHALVRPGLWLAGQRLGAGWESFDYLRDAQRLSVPILLFHGDRDPVVPVGTSDALAGLRPDIVHYHRVPGAAHGQSWNVNPVRYEAAVRAFLARIV